MVATQKRILVLVRTQLAYGREVTRGIARFARGRPDWRLFSLVPHDDVPPKDRLADAAIGHNPEVALGELLAPGAPRVYTGYAKPGEEAGAARVRSDDEAIGRLGAQHLVGLGIRNLAYAGSSERFGGFERGALEAGRRLLMPPLEPVTEAGSGWRGDLRPLVRWLRNAPRPLGVMAEHDLKARRVLSAVRLAGLAVPEEVAVLGVDNDELLCDLSDPPLSSIEQGAQQIGYRAASLLAELLEGRSAPPEPVLVPPVRVVVRQSTDVLAVDDPEVAAAVRYIRRAAAGPVRIDAVADAAATARRTLERRFKRVMGHTMHEETILARVRLAREMLAVSDRPLPAVAAACGFNSLKHFHETFRRHAADTPAAYRRAHQFRA